MLQSLREKFMGWPGVIIFGGLGLLMAVAFGVGSYNVSNRADWVAKVGDHEISQQDYQTQMNNLRRQMSQQQGSQFDASLFQKPEFKQKVVDGMADRYLIQQSGQKLGMLVTNDMVREQIASTPVFQVNGKFDSDTYLAVLTRAGLTPVGYQQQVHDDLATRMLPDVIESTSILGMHDVDDYLKLQLQTRDVKYVVLPRPALTDTTVADKDVEAWYKAHRAQFMTPERVAIKYIELDAAKLPAPRIDEAALKARYASEKNRFVQPEQRLVSHILIEVPGNATPAQQKAALAKADKVDALAHATGADFAALAKKYSDDAGSSIQGGELGWLQQGVAEKAFDTALFSMHKGEISKPVLGPDGYHIIWLRDIRAGKVKPFADVREDLLDEMRKSERAKQYSELAGKLTDLVYQNPSSLEPAARKLGLTIHSSEPFPRDGGKQGITANPDVVKAAFSSDVLKDGNSSDPIRLGPNHIVVLHVVEHDKATPKPLAEVSAGIRQSILDQRIDAKARQQAEAALAKVRKAGDLGQLGKAEKYPARSLDGAHRNQPGVTPGMLDIIFKMRHPAKGKPSFALADLGGGSFALLSLEAVHPGKLDSIPEAQRKFLLGQMRKAYGTLALDAWVKQLRADAGVKVAKDRL